MEINSGENYNMDKIRTFNKAMIEAIKNKEDMFEFENEQYNISSDGVFVQTLINNRILYRIYIEEEKNDDSINYELMNYLKSKTMTS